MTNFGGGKLEDGEKSALLRRLIGASPDLMAQLQAVSALDLPDCWIGAGAIRNLVWDSLDPRVRQDRQDKDVDVVFFDPADCSIDREKALEEELASRVTGMDWQVRNQARMHLRNGDPAYRNTEDGLRHWPETATAIAARLVDDRIELLTPFGLDDLLGMIVRPTPAFRHKRDIFLARQAKKNWRARWPGLSFVD